MMIPDELRLPIIDFICMAETIPNLKVAVLFGSAVKGGFHKKSDIDLLLLFDVENNPEVGEEAKVAHEVGSDILSKHNLPHSFSFVMDNLNDPRLDSDFLRTVVNEGVVIWARPETNILRNPQPNMEPISIFSYSLTELSPKEKMAVHRALYGYRVVKVVKGKRYVNESKGLVGEFGEKLADGVFLIPSRYSNDVVERFKPRGVKYRKLDVWR